MTGERRPEQRDGEPAAGREVVDPDDRARSLRARVFDLLVDDDGEEGSFGYWLRRLLVLLILTSVVGAVLDSLPQLAPWLRELLRQIEIFAVIVFSFEYGARLWAIVEDRSSRFGHPLWGRLRYAATPAALIDLMAILPFYLSLLSPGSLVVLRLLRILRILKLVRYSRTLATFQMVLINERHALGLALGVMGVLLLVSASIMQAVEGTAQPDRFGSVPAAMWWAVVTLSTVGYGDMVPVTTLGRMVAGFVSMLGIAMFALPTAILGAGLMQELQKRSFATAAALIARVPLFRQLASHQLAELTALLKPREVPAGYTLIRRGERGDAMYFLVEGEVLVRRGQRRRTLRSGAFFGEMALLEGRPRMATVVALTPCRLLELQARDFHRLLAGDVELRRVIVEEAQRRSKGFEAGD